MSSLIVIRKLSRIGMREPQSSICIALPLCRNITMNFSSSDTGKKFHSELFSELKWQKVTISPEMFENGVNIVLEASCCECVSFKWTVFYEWGVGLWGQL